MLRKIDRAQILEIWRFYQVGVVNLLFGLGAYSLFVWLGLNIFVAQLLGHVSGTIFNYFSYRLHVFRSSEPAKTRFVLAYFANYLLGVAALAATSRFIASPSAAGALAVLIVSVINYAMLKRLVFRTRAT
jgi:putative flippase GtrA